MLRNEKKNTIQEELSFHTDETATTANSSECLGHVKTKKRKIVALGQMGAGKTSIIKRFVDGRLPGKPSSTFEETCTKDYFYKNEEVKLFILDTAGQSEFTPALPSRYSVGVNGYMLIFAINDNHSFEIIQHVNKILIEGIGTKYVPRILVGNKTDLESEREVSLERIKKLANSLKCPYIECSSTKGGSEIEKIFYKLLKEIEKENDNEYPYDTRVSTLSLNFIRKHHTCFNVTLLFILGLLFLCGLFCVILTIILAVLAKTFFNIFMGVNLLFALILCFASFRGFRIVKKQFFQSMNSINIWLYLTILINLLLIASVTSQVLLPDILLEYIEKFPLLVIYLSILFLQLIIIVINKNLQPLYREFYSTMPINQQLLVKI